MREKICVHVLGSRISARRERLPAGAIKAPNTRRGDPRH